MTGNTEEIAQILAKDLRELDVEVEFVEALQVYPDELPEYDLCIVATYTYGTDGEVPDELIDFHEDLTDEDLSGKVYGVLGSGQSFYEHFCRAVDHFDEQFQLAGATKGADSLKFELNASGEEDLESIRNFAKGLVDTYNKMHG